MQVSRQDINLLIEHVSMQGRKRWLAPRMSALYRVDVSAGDCGWVIGAVRDGWCCVEVTRRAKGKGR
jgi:hypothetical protein